VLPWAGTTTSAASGSSRYGSTFEAKPELVPA
jgi:hypothetical protein